MLQLDDRLLCGWKNHTGQTNSTQYDITVIWITHIVYHGTSRGR